MPAEGEANEKTDRRAAPLRGIRAAVLPGVRRPVRIEELELASPGPGQVLVRMAASGVCRSDLHQADGHWDDPGPMVLGHEGAGRIEAVGPGVTAPAVGDLVALNWYFPCRACARCLAGLPSQCTGTTALADRLPDGTTPLRRGDGTEVLPMLALGTWAEAAVVPAQAAVPLPPEVPPEVAALIGCAVTTGAAAVLRTAAVPAGSSVVVIGAGGVGLSAVMAAAVAGAATVVAVDRVAEKLDRARQLGATDAVLASDDARATKRAVREAVGGRPDFALECIGLPATVELAIDLVGSGGTAVLIGIPPLRQHASFDVGYLIDRSARVIGANYGGAVPDEDFPRLARLYLDGRLPIDRLVEERIPLDGVGDALEALRAGAGLRRVIVF
ncbi:MAG TPA: zinc-binding dehydrogenase [Actinomycetota bacterium]|nr:zinc-binding dehydrogenase [Actinomycetota bacterium]